MAERTIKKVKYGNTERRSFAQVKEVCEMPYLAEIQKSSYKEFLRTGIGEVFKDFSPIRDFSNKLELYFTDHRIEMTPKYTEKECKDRDVTYAVPLKVKARLVNKETGEITEQEVFMGDIPLMTPNGSFIINGAERVVVSQLVRSPGVYFSFVKDNNTGVNYYGATNIPSRGAWLEFQEDDKGVLWVHVDRERKVQATVLMRALASVAHGDFEDPDAILQPFKNIEFMTDEELAKMFHDEPLIVHTIEKDPNHDVPDYSDVDDNPMLSDAEKQLRREEIAIESKFFTEEAALKELNRKLRPGEVPNINSIRQYIRGLFFDRRKYDLSRVGRYKFNKKLALSARIANMFAFDDIVDTSTGEIIVAKGDYISEETAVRIQNLGINEVAIEADGAPEGKHIVIGNAHVSLAGYIDCDPK